MQSILKPTDNSATTQPTLPPAHRVQRVAFQTDCAAKPISKIELKVLKGEWSMFKVGVQIVPPSFFATYVFLLSSAPANSKQVYIPLSRPKRDSEHCSLAERIALSSSYRPKPDRDGVLFASMYADPSFSSLNDILPQYRRCQTSRSNTLQP